jgi:hypothetical protein
MPFGKYAGQRLDEVPTDYLLWALGEIGPRLDRHGLGLHQAIIDEVRRRDGQTDPDTNAWDAGVCGTLPARMQPLIARWYRNLVLRWHPDRGGSTQAMQAVNDAHDRLRQMVGV